MSTRSYNSINPADSEPDRSTTDDSDDRWKQGIVSQSLTGKLIDLGQLDNTGSERLRLVECPACGEDWTDDYNSNGPSGIAEHLLKDHLPEDFGLTPLQENHEN